MQSFIMARQRASPFLLRTTNTTATARSFIHNSTPLRRQYISPSSLSGASKPTTSRPTTLLSRLLSTPFAALRQRNLSTSLRLRNNTTPPRPSPDPTPNLGSPPGPTASLSLSQRLKKLSREYGWSAFGVYMALSALDFPFCFLAVRVLGTERIGRWEHIVVDGAKQSIYYPLKSALGWADGNAVEEAGHTVEEGAAAVLRGDVPSLEGLQEDEGKSNVGWGVEEAQEAHTAEATLWTQLVLAYAIHKSFIFIRVPLTAAVTPKVVKTLRGWGWDIGKRKPKAAKVAAAGPK